MLLLVYAAGNVCAQNPERGRPNAGFQRNSGEKKQKQGRPYGLSGARAQTRKGNPSPRLSKEYKPRGVRTAPRAGNRSSVRSIRHRYRSGNPAPLLSKRKGVTPRRGNPSPRLSKEYKPRGVRTAPHAGNRSSVRSIRHRYRSGNPSPLLSKEYKPRGVRTAPARGGFSMRRTRHREPGKYANNRVRAFRHGSSVNNQVARPFPRSPRHPTGSNQFARSPVRRVRHGQGGAFARTPLRSVRHRQDGQYARSPVRGVRHGPGGAYARSPLRGVRHRQDGLYARTPLRGVRHRQDGLYARMPLRSVRHRQDGLYAKMPLRRVRHQTIDGTACSRVRIRHHRLDGTACARVRIQHRNVDGTSCARLRVKHRQYDGTACARERVRHRNIDGTSCARLRIRHSNLDGMACNRARIRHRVLDGTTCARLKIHHTPVHKYRVPCDPSMRHTTQWQKLAMDVEYLMRNHKKYCKLNNICSGVSAGQIVETQDYGTAVVADYIIGERIQRFVRYTSEDSTRRKVVVRKTKAVEQIVVIVNKRQELKRNARGEAKFKRVLLSQEESKAIMIDYLLKKDQLYWIIRMYPEEKKNLPELLARSKYRHYGGVTVPMGIPNIPYPRQLNNPPAQPPAKPAASPVPAPAIR
ncbi:MAG: hypothetical protein KF690_09220 [Bacteroidetes bacterium]|nr:hypothetical protein [Bacteroidota bacterium]